MKKLMVLLVALMIAAGNALAYNWVNNPPVLGAAWNIVRTTTDAESIYSPATGVYRLVGGKTLYFTLNSPATSWTYSILFYQENGTSLISTESVTVGVAKTLLSPNFKLKTACTTLEPTVRGTGEVYVVM